MTQSLLLHGDQVPAALRVPVDPVTCAATIRVTSLPTEPLQIPVKMGGALWLPQASLR